MDASRQSKTTVREEVAEPLRRTLSWLASLRDEQGRIWCPEHLVEHTGKSACAAVLACTLLEVDPQADEEFLISFARQQGQRLVDNLEREGDSPCHTFRPGRHDPYNCSNSVIDGGACSDALAQVVETLGSELSEEERASFSKASRLHAMTYLRYAILDKGIPAQRAWGLSGLAQACGLADGSPEQASENELMEEAAMQAVGMLEGIQNPDGSYPYHPLDWGAGHAGAADASGFYQSRITGFLIFALARLGRDPSARLFRKPLVRGLAFLSSLQGPFGKKVGLVEAKPWYWGANHEVASHVFDAYALVRGAELFGRKHWGAQAVLAFKSWAKHLDEQGRPQSHLPPGVPGSTGHWRRSYQCPIFWAGHAAWMGRAALGIDRFWDQEVEFPAALDAPANFDQESSKRSIKSSSATEASSGSGSGAEVAEESTQTETVAAVAAAPRPTSLDLRITHFPSVDIVRLEDHAVVAWVRGKRPPFNAHHGSPHGAGLLRCVRKSDGQELVTRCRLAGVQEGEWSGHAGPISLRRGWRSGGDEVRFSAWLARAHWRAGRRKEAFKTPPRILTEAVLAFGSGRVGSAFSCDPLLRLNSDGCSIETSLARRDGTPMANTSILRHFSLDGEGLVVTERLLQKGRVRRLNYLVPKKATEVQRSESQISYHLG